MNIKTWIFIALIIAEDEGWGTNLQWFSSNLSPATRVGDGVHRRGGTKFLLFFLYHATEK